MSIGGKWVNTRVPSMPSHQKVWCGNLFVWFQEIFWVRNHCRPGQLHQLRQRRGVAERVRQPDLLGLDPVLVQEEPLAVHELPGQRLAAGHVGVGLDPHAADRDDGAVGNGLLQPLPHLAGSCPSSRRAAGPARTRTRSSGYSCARAVDVRDGPGDLAPGLAQRPQPGRVDVRVPDRGQLVRAGVRRPASTSVSCARASAAVPAMSVVVEGVQRAAQCPQDLPAARLLQGQLLHAARPAPRGRGSGPTPRR